MKFTDLTGQRFGTLTALTHESRRGPSYTASGWICRCDCGIEKFIPAIALVQGKTKTCATKGCPFMAEFRMKAHGARDYIHGRQHVFAMYRRKALDRGREFGLTREEFWEIIAADCHYCGAPPSNVSKRGPRKQDDFFYSGVDRVDSKGGYVTGNVRPCCWKCNCMKNDLSDSEFYDHLRRIINHRQPRLVVAA